MPQAQGGPECLSPEPGNRPPPHRCSPGATQQSRRKGRRRAPGPGRKKQCCWQRTVFSVENCRVSQRIYKKLLELRVSSGRREATDGRKTFANPPLTKCSRPEPAENPWKSTLRKQTTQLKGSKSSKQTPRPRRRHVANKDGDAQLCVAPGKGEPPQGGVTAAMSERLKSRPSQHRAPDASEDAERPDPPAPRCLEHSGPVEDSGRPLMKPSRPRPPEPEIALPSLYAREAFTQHPARECLQQLHL